MASIFVYKFGNTLMIVAYEGNFMKLMYPIWLLAMFVVLRSKNWDIFGNNWGCILSISPYIKNSTKSRSVQLRHMLKGFVGLEMSAMWNMNLIRSSWSLESCGWKLGSATRLLTCPSSSKCLFMSVFSTVMIMTWRHLLKSALDILLDQQRLGSFMSWNEDARW